MNFRELKYLFGCAVLLSLGFPPFPFGFLAPVSIAISLYFFQQMTGREGFRLGYWYGLFWGATSLYWIAASTVAGAILAVLINSFHFAILWSLFVFLRNRHPRASLVLYPFLWTGMEYLRNLSEFRFNWLSLPHTQTYYLPFIQFIEWTGPLGLTLLITTFGVLLYLMLMRPRWRVRGAVAISLTVLLLLVYGYCRIHDLERGNVLLLRAGIVQPNVDPFEKWDPEFQEAAFNMLMEANRELAPANPNLVVWPETATPFYLRARFSKLTAIKKWVDSTGIALLTGTPDYVYPEGKEEYKTYNAAFFFRPNHAGFDYHYKLTLVPGAEGMPYNKYLPLLSRINIWGGDYSAGEKYTVFRFKPLLFQGKYAGGKWVRVEEKPEKREVGISTAICFESVFHEVVRRFVKVGANVLTIITNDGWFGFTGGPYQHRQIAVLRAIENRISIIRSANTGISCYILPTGKIIREAALGVKKNLVADVPVTEKHTFFTKHGDIPGKISLIVLLGIVLFKLYVWVAQGVGKKG